VYSGFDFFLYVISIMSLTLPPPSLLPSNTFASPEYNLWFPADGNVVIDGNQTVTGETTVGGNVTVVSGLTVSGTTALSGDVKVTNGSMLGTDNVSSVNCPNATVTASGYAGGAYQATQTPPNLLAGLSLGLTFEPFGTAHFEVYPANGNSPANPIAIGPPASSPTLRGVQATCNKTWILMESQPGGFGTFAQIDPPSSLAGSSIPLVYSPNVPIGTSGFFYNFTNVPGSVQISNFTGNTWYFCITFV
jgi:hypothetical protein